jgi:hypothetical protein
MKKFSLLTFLTIFATLGCQSSPVKIACSESDWFELGRRDGAIGKPLQIQSHKARCGKDLSAANENLYVQGYNNGLSEYCSPDNGFAIGRSGGNPSKICPAPLDTHFFAAVRKGIKARQAEETN